MKPFRPEYFSRVEKTKYPRDSAGAQQAGAVYSIMFSPPAHRVLCDERVFGYGAGVDCFGCGNAPALLADPLAR